MNACHAEHRAADGEPAADEIREKPRPDVRVALGLGDALRLVDDEGAERDERRARSGARPNGRRVRAIISVGVSPAAYGGYFFNAESGDDLVDALRVRIEECLERIAGEVHVGPVVALQRRPARTRS